MSQQGPSLYQLMLINKVAHYKNDKFLPKSYTLKYSSDSLGFSKKGYYGVAAVDDDNKQVIICNAGTRIDKNDLKNLFYDFTSNWQIANSRLPDQYKYALSFTQTSLDKLPNNYNITITGFSLGAVLADLTSFTLYQKFSERLHDITFENPGSQSIIKKTLAKNNPEINTKISSNFHAYNAQANVINMFDVQMGKEHKICLDETRFSETLIDNKKLNYLIDGHLFENFLSGAFDRQENIRLCNQYDWLDL